MNEEWLTGLQADMLTSQKRPFVSLSACLLSALGGSMNGPTRTSRQQIMDMITGVSMSSLELAQALGMPEREVEGHLAHIVRSIAKDRMRRFMLQPSACDHCGFVFRQRTRLTRPSRCPRCQSERISPPRYEIRPRGGVAPQSGGLA